MLECSLLGLTAGIDHICMENVYHPYTFLRLLSYVDYYSK
jgi:hypothetical protein